MSCHGFIALFLENSWIIFHGLPWWFNGKESPCSPRDSQVSYPTPQFKSINSSALSLLYGSGLTSIILGFPGGSEGKESACNAGDLGSIPGLGRSPGGGHGNSLHYSCLENPMDREAWWAIVHGVAKSQTRLNDFTFTSSLSHIHLWLLEKP